MPPQVAVPPDEADLLNHPAMRLLREQMEAERVNYRAEAARLRQTRTNLNRQAASGKPDHDGKDLWKSTNNRLRKRGLYDLYKQSVILGSIVDIIAKRFVSGTWSIAPLKDVAGIADVNWTGDPGDQLLLAEFFSHCNEAEDLKQMLYGWVIDLCIYGETYIETTFQAGVPYELYSCATAFMDYIDDGYGRVIAYTFADPTDALAKPKLIDPETITRIWVPDRERPLQPFSLIEGMVNALYSDQMMVRTQHKTFENMGSAAQVVYEMGEDSSEESADRFVTKLEEQYSGVQNAGRERVLYSGTKAYALNLKGIDADFLQGRKEARYEALGRAGVTPAMIGLIETGNIGGGTGDAQERSFVQNVLHFYKHFICEKGNYGIINRQWYITGWALNVTFADVIGDPDASSVETLDEKRAKQGLPPSEGENGKYTILEIKSKATGSEPELGPDGLPLDDGTNPADKGKGKNPQGGKTKTTPTSGKESVTEVHKVQVSARAARARIDYLDRALKEWADANKPTPSKPAEPEGESDG